MNFDELAKIMESFLQQGLQDKGVETFADMCLRSLYQDYAIPDTVSYLVHYTTLDALLSMLGVNAENNRPFALSRATDQDNPNNNATGGFLRLYDTFYANDPNEGNFFVNSVEQSNPFRRLHKEIWDLFEHRSKLPAYLGSLVCVDNLKEVDDLVFWRTYGRDGSGCALAFPISCFDGLNRLFRVLYGQQAVTSCLEKLNQICEEYSTISEVPHIKDMASRINTSIMKGLSPLVYLHKSEDYMYEKEARIIVPFPDIDPDDLYCQISTTTGSPPRWRHFAHLPELRLKRLLVSDSWVMLGPTVHAADNIKFVLQQILDRFAPLGPKVKTSTISYRS